MTVRLMAQKVIARGMGVNGVTGGAKQLGAVVPGCGIRVDDVYEALNEHTLIPNGQMAEERERDQGVGGSSLR